MTDVLKNIVRKETGRNAVKRTRAAGYTPAILYGHQQDNVCLAVPSDQVHAAIRHGSKLVELQGDVVDTALIREVQWDAFGMDVLHVDLTRVTKGETIHVSVPLELRGESPGSKEGGIVEQSLHEVEVECSAGNIPEKIEIRLHDLHVGQSIKLGDIQLPEGVSLVSSADDMAVNCFAAAAVAEEEELEEAAAGAAEPEIIGRKADEGEEEGD
jgi:large subunit ribosomal protein L25